MAEFNVVVEKDEEGWLISEVVGLPGCHTQAKTMEELVERTKEAIQSYLEVEKISEPSTKFIEVKQIEV
tara:strand:+ start:281 stop:487 length:207 start_codon:yes stop_codon:yes gene_type:complete